MSEFTKPWPNQCPSYTEYVGTDFFTALEIVNNTKPVYSPAETVFLVPCCRYNVLVFAQDGLGKEYGCPTTSGTNFCPRLPKEGRALSPFFGPPKKPKIKSYFTALFLDCFIR